MITIFISNYKNRSHISLPINKIIVERQSDVGMKLRNCNVGKENDTQKKKGATSKSFVLFCQVDRRKNKVCFGAEAKHEFFESIETQISILLIKRIWNFLFIL